MKKATHRYIASTIYDNLEKKLQDKLSLIHFMKGSAHPDINLKLRFTNHTYKGSFDIVLDLVNKVLTRNYSKEELSFKLGIASHFMMDYCCAFHSNPGVKKKYWLHTQYEIKIQQNLNLIDNNPEGPIYSDLESIQDDLEYYLEYNHSEDMNINPKRDLVHAYTMAKSFMNLVLEEHMSLKESTISYKNKVLIITDSITNANSSNHPVYQYIDILRASNKNYLLITPKNKSFDWRKELGLKIKKSKPRKIVFYPLAMRKFLRNKSLKKIIRDYAPDVIHSLSVLQIGKRVVKYARKRNVPIISNAGFIQ